MSGVITGSCHCGAAGYEVRGEPQAHFHCQCTSCARLSDSGHAALMVVPRAAVATRGALRAYDYKADSGRVVTRWFCPVCGTGLFNTNSGLSDITMLMASSLDDVERFKPQAVVCASSGASWDVMSPELKSYPRGFRS